MSQPQMLRPMQYPKLSAFRKRNPFAKGFSVFNTTQTSWLEPSGLRVGVCDTRKATDIRETNSIIDAQLPVASFSFIQLSTSTTNASFMMKALPKRKFFAVVLTMACLLLVNLIYGQTTQRFTNNGTSSFTAPAGVGTVTVQVWGAGGGGGKGAGGSGNGGSGGGGGAYISGIFSVSNATPINFTVGKGGDGGSTNAASSGTASTFSTISAGGGGLVSQAEVRVVLQELLQVGLTEVLGRRPVLGTEASVATPEILVAAGGLAGLAAMVTVLMVL